MATVYLRDFPEELHRKAKSEAAAPISEFNNIVKRNTTNQNGGGVWNRTRKSGFARRSLPSATPPD